MRSQGPEGPEPERAILGRRGAARGSMKQNLPDPTARGAASGAQTAFLRALRDAAASQAAVLLEGESGSGKGRAAQWLHEHGARPRGPFVVANLAALSSSLAESELFGHEAGAYTGASGPRRGRFRQAEGGTLVLDEVAALPLALQPKLLRALQERSVEPLGAERPVPVDVRIVATTSADLRELAARGAFREDLYYRLAVVVLRVPALRERTGDVPELAAELVGELARRAGVPARALAPGALERLDAHSWPGNVRELENALERVLVLRPAESPGAPVEAAELDFLGAAGGGVAEELAQRALAHGLTLPDLERTLLDMALRECRGNVSAAARKVGLSRRALEYRLGRADSASGAPS